MGEFSPIHWLIVLAVILILFGGRKIPELMKGVGEGIRSFKEGVSGAAQGTSTPTAQVLAPTGLAAKAGRGQVALSWTASAGAVTYNVKRSSSSGGPYALIASTGATSHSDEGLASAAYYYVVTSAGAQGESANSIEVSATPTA
jgi:TatA/E family protein of Tat protein translocase